MTPPFVAACKPKRVGPKTIERLELDMELSADSWLILFVEGGQHFYKVRENRTLPH